MYAVIESGGKQYRVELGAEIQVDRLDARPGEAITLDRVLLVADGDATAVGKPLVDGAAVVAEVLRQERGDKIVVFKYKPKARTRVKQGHRAELTTLRIADIAFGGKSAAKEAQQSESKKSKALREAEQEAEQKAAADRELAAKLAATAASADDAPEAAAPTRATKRKTAAPAADEATESVAIAADSAVEAAATPATDSATKATRKATRSASTTVQASAADGDAGDEAVPMADTAIEPDIETAEADSRKDE